MSVAQRVFICRLLEKMKEQEAYSNKLGIEDVSSFHGKQLETDIQKNPTT